ncbi:MAG: SIMPL domain-containing protein [Candidatus Margulisiibacteriota bacterium]|jgi:hypothetical protein
MNEQKPALIIGLAFVIGMLAFGGFYYSAQLSVSNRDILSVTGSAKTRVNADQGKLTISLARQANANTLANGYAGLAHDLILTRTLLKKEGVADIAESPVSMNQVYDQNNTGPTKYTLNQTVTVQLNDVVKITKLSKMVPSLTEQGAVISVQALEYYYSKLPDLRVSLLSEAVKDAKARAEKIAEGTGRHVGSVAAASSGVVQVLTPNSVDVSDYGSYDTSSVVKDIMVTVKASFYLK